MRSRRPGLECRDRDRWQWAESASVSATATAAGSASAISSRMAVPDPYAAAGRRMGEGLGRATASSIFDSDEAPPRNGQHVRRQPLEGISGVEDDSCSGTAAVLGSEGPQMPGITESGVSRAETRYMASRQLQKSSWPLGLLRCVRPRIAL